MSKVAVITGGSSGIGLSTAKALYKMGVSVYELSRHDAHTENIVHVDADVTDRESVERAVSFVFSKEGRIDILVSCAGFGISGAVEFAKEEDIIRQMDVNFMGAVRCAQTVIPYMRRKGGGSIIGISSVAAPIPIPFQAFYSASKASIESFMTALRNEAATFGITACCVRPGDINTGFTKARNKNMEGDDVYGGRISKSVAGMEKDEIGGMDPDVAGAYIARVCLKKKPKPFYSVGFVYKLFCVLKKMLPSRVWNYIVGLMYA